MARAKSAPVGAPLPPPMEFHWTVMQIAVHHQMEPSAVIAAIERGDLEALKPGKAYQIPDSAYREWLSGSKVVKGKELMAR